MSSSKSTETRLRDRIGELEKQARIVNAPADRLKWTEAGACRSIWMQKA